jgi:cytochrome b561
MLRRIAAVSLAVSFVAMATSGILMFVVEKPSFTIQMHPVHKVFGILMIAAAVTHLSLNFRGLVNHLKTRSIAVYGSVLVAALVLLYGVAVYKEIPADLAQQMDEAAAKMEGED